MNSPAQRGRKLCRSCVADTNTRCSRPAPFWSPYCFQHRKSVTGRLISIAALIGSFVFGLVTDVGKEKVKARYFEAHARLAVSLNGQPLSEDTVLFFSPNRTNDFSLVFRVDNEGDKEADDVRLTLQVPQGLRDYVRGEGWTFVATNYAENLSLEHQIGILHRKSTTAIEALALDVRHAENLGAGVQLRGKGIENPDERLHVFFESQPGDTNRLVGGAAKDFLRSRFGARYGEKRLHMNILKQ